jgi:epoxyqueuosine reductase QueG
MDITNEILEQAMKRFDSAGVVAVERGTVLMLGLAHTQERNLDEGVIENGRFRNKVWPQQVKPRMMDLRDILLEKGFKAEPVGWWGYPSGDVMRLKRMAVLAGLGLQGKNTLILDPNVGHRIRFAALWTDAPLTSTGPGVDERREHPSCRSCNLCIDACPVEGLLEPYRLIEPARCLCNLDSILVRGRMGECREACRTVCPVGR